MKIACVNEIVLELLLGILQLEMNNLHFFFLKKKRFIVKIVVMLLQLLLLKCALIKRAKRGPKNGR